MDVWDAKFTGWVMHWDFHQVFRDPLHLFDANIFYPARYALAFSENLFGAAVFGFPLYAAGASTLLTHNILFLLGMGLSGMGAWALARHVTGDEAASLLAGLVYAFNPWRLAQIPHIQFQWGAFLPLFLLFLLKYLDGGRRRDALLFALFFAWNALANVHYALFGGMLVATVLAYEGLVGGVFEKKKVLAGSLLGLAIACLAVLPFFIPYLRVAEMYGVGRTAEEMLFFSGRPIDFLTAGSQNKLYAPLTQKWGKAEGDFFPGLIPLFLAILLLLKLRAPGEEKLERAPDSLPRQRKALGILDGVLVALFALWVWATLRPGLAVGPLKLTDPGMILVVLAALLLARWLVALPRRSRFENLADFLRRVPFGPRAGLFVTVALLGVLVALGGNTPFYRFLFESFGAVMRGIRAPARGIVLFHLGLAVLSAWGLSLLAKRREGRVKWKRGAWIAGAVLLTGFEYRAFPVILFPVAQDPAPVYRWLATVNPPGAVIEWPFGTDYDVEYQFRSTTHWHPLLNGYSGTGPPHYHALAAVLNEKPIPEKAWRMIRDLGGSLIILHSHFAPGQQALPEFARAARRWLASGKIELVGAFPHAQRSDYVFRMAGSPPFETGIAPRALQRTAEDLEADLRRAEAETDPPFGALDMPTEKEPVAGGSWGYGWALDDSGIREVVFSVDGGPPRPAVFGGDHPGVGELYPKFADAQRPGYGFQLPALAPGKHTLAVTLVAKDGGRTTILRVFRAR